MRFKSTQVRDHKCHNITPSGVLIVMPENLNYCFNEILFSDQPNLNNVFLHSGGHPAREDADDGHTRVLLPHQGRNQLPSRRCRRPGTRETDEIEFAFLRSQNNYDIQTCAEKRDCFAEQQPGSQLSAISFAQPCM